MAASSVGTPVSGNDYFPLLRLPQEIRDSIYDRLFYTTDHDVQLCPQLLGVNRQINHEATRRMVQNCTFVLVELRDIRRPLHTLNRSTAELDHEYWDTQEGTPGTLAPSLPHHRTTNPDTKVFLGKHFKHYSMKIVLKEREVPRTESSEDEEPEISSTTETEEHETGSAAPYENQQTEPLPQPVEWIMLIGKAALNRFARQIMVPNDFHASSGWDLNARDNLSIAVEIYPSLSEEAQKKRDADLLEPLKVHWRHLRSISITGMRNSSLCEAAIQTMKGRRWSSGTDWIEECRSVLKDVLAAISVRDDKRAIEACIHGEILTEGIQATESLFPLSQAVNDELSDLRWFFCYYWSKLKMAAVCSSYAETIANRKAVVIYLQSIELKLLKVYREHICPTEKTISQNRDDGFVPLKTDAECAELAYELSNILCILSEQQTGQRLKEAIEMNPLDFRVQIANEMLQKNSLRLVPITMGSMILWEPKEELPEMMRLRRTRAALSGM